MPDGSEYPLRNGSTLSEVEELPIVVNVSVINNLTHISGYPSTRHLTLNIHTVWKRPSFWWSPSISRSLDAALDVSALRPEDIDIYDFYSCFPIVPKLACHHLGIPILNSDKPLTLLGGLTSFGGAGNNYSLHVSDARSSLIISPLNRTSIRPGSNR
jgi:hypothetical protein